MMQINITQYLILISQSIKSFIKPLLYISIDIKRFFFEYLTKLDNFNKLDIDEANYLKEIINLGGKINFYITISVGGVEYLKNLNINLNRSILPDLSFQYLEDLVIENATIKEEGFYFPKLRECRIFNSQLPSNLEFINLHTKIFELIIRSCNLATIPKLDNMRYLRLLNLSNNEINSIKSLHNDICCRKRQE